MGHPRCGRARPSVGLSAAATSQHSLSLRARPRGCVSTATRFHPLRRLCPCKAGSPNPHCLLPLQGMCPAPAPSPRPSDPRGPHLPTHLPLGLRGVFTPGAWCWTRSPVPEGASLGLPGQPGKASPCRPLPAQSSPACHFTNPNQPGNCPADPGPRPALAVHLRSQPAWSADSECGASPGQTSGDAVPAAFRSCPAP